MPRGKSKGDVFVARESFSCEIDGERINVAAGEYVREGHDLLKVYPDSFQNVRDARVKWDMPEVEERAPAR